MVFNKSVVFVKVSALARALKTVCDLFKTDKTVANIKITRQISLFYCPIFGCLRPETQLLVYS